MNWKTTAAAIGVALLASTSLASADGELHIYNWGNYTSPEMIKKFETENNVKVTITDYDLNDTALAEDPPGRPRLRHGRSVAELHPDLDPGRAASGVAADEMANFKNVKEDLKNPRIRPWPPLRSAVGDGHRRHRRQHRRLQGPDQHLGHHLRHTCRAEGQGQRRSRDDRRDRRGRCSTMAARNAPATWKS